MTRLVAPAGWTGAIELNELPVPVPVPVPGRRGIVLVGAAEAERPLPDAQIFAGDVTLAAPLYRPPGVEGDLPGVVLSPGSGPQTLD